MLWENLTVPQFADAVQSTDGVCILPMGVMEPHALHLPLGIDSFVSFEVSKRAAEIEPAIVLPVSYWGPNHACYHRAGGIVIRMETVLNLLQDICDEAARNGLKKIIINPTGHDGVVFPLFMQRQLERDVDYVVYHFKMSYPPEFREMLKAKEVGHADEMETSEMLYLNKDLVDMNALSKEPVTRTRVSAHLSAAGLSQTFTHWFGEYPIMQVGHGGAGTAEKGDLFINYRVKALVNAIRTVKNDTISPELQKRYQELKKNPGSGWDPDILNGILERTTLERERRFDGQNLLPKAK